MSFQALLFCTLFFFPDFSAGFFSSCSFLDTLSFQLFFIFAVALNSLLILLLFFESFLQSLFLFFAFKVFALSSCIILSGNLCFIGLSSCLFILSIQLPLFGVLVLRALILLLFTFCVFIVVSSAPSLFQCILVLIVLLCINEAYWTIIITIAFQVLMS